MNIVVTQRENPEVELEYVDASYAQEDTDVKSGDGEYVESAEYATGTQEKPTATLANVRKFHFYPKHDLMLLRQALESQAFLAPYGRTEAAWTEVQMALKQQAGMNVEVRTLRDRFMLLIKKYEAGDTRSLKRSGAPQEHDEVEELLAQIVEMRASYAEQRKLSKQHGAAHRAGDEDGGSGGPKQRKRVYVTENGETFMTTDTEDALMNTAGSESAVEFGVEDVTADASGLAAKRVRKISLLSLLAETHARRKVEAENERLRLEVESERLRLKAEKLRVEEKRIEMEAKQREEERKQQAEQFRTLLQAVLDIKKK